jgi:ABC-type branched-subunit amino acid transport system substrate-binding protein
MKKVSLLVVVSFLLLAVVLLPLLSACTPEPAEAETLKIGAITSVTGPLAPGLKAVFDAAKPAADVFNQRGGVTVNGQQYLIEIVVEDDKSSPPDAVAAAQKLIQAGIKFIVMPVLPPNVHALAPVCEEAKAIRVSAMQCDPGMFGPENRYHFDAVMTVYYISTYYDYLIKNYPQVKKVAILMPDDPGMDVPGIVTPQEAQKRGLEVVFQERYPNDTQDFYPIVTKALAQKPDVIDGIGGLAVWAAPIINSARELGFTGPIIAPCGLGDTNLINSMLKPEYAYEFYNGNPDVLSDKMTPIVKELRPLVEQTETPFFFDSTLVLTASWIMLQGIEKAQSFDTDQVVAAIENMESYDTPWGKGTWGGEDLGGLNHMGKPDNISISKIMNGKVEFEFVKRLD